MEPLDAVFQSHPLLWGEVVAVGFWVLTVGYYFLMFTYLFSNRYLFKPKEERQVFWAAFSLFFIFSAIGRVFQIVNDFFVENLFIEKVGVGFQWFSLACMSIVVATVLVENESIPEWLGYVYVTPPIAIGISYFIVPPQWISLFMAPGMLSPYYIIANFIFVPIYAFSILGLFFWTASLIPGKVRTNSILNAIGFIIWYAGRLFYSQVGEVIRDIIISTTGIYFPISIPASSLIIVSLILFAYSTRE
ncbi:MAG: hypothetical protein ACXQS8_00050 [Candidatus Helarchaeales archaeon]